MEPLSNNQNQVFLKFHEGDMKKKLMDEKKQTKSKDNNNLNQVFSRVHAGKKLMDDNKEKQIESKDDNRRRMAKRLVLEDVDTVADDFINNFKNQLKLEREDSLKRFQDMIARGI